MSGLVPYMSAEEIAGKKVIVFANLKVRASVFGRGSGGGDARERRGGKTDGDASRTTSSRVNWRDWNQTG